MLKGRASPGCRKTGADPWTPAARDVPSRHPRTRLVFVVVLRAKDRGGDSGRSSKQIVASDAGATYLVALSGDVNALITSWRAWLSIQRLLRCSYSKGAVAIKGRLGSQ